MKDLEKVVELFADSNNVEFKEETHDFLEVTFSIKLSRVPSYNEYRSVFEEIYLLNQDNIVIRLIDNDENIEISEDDEVQYNLKKSELENVYLNKSCKLKVVIERNKSNNSLYLYDVELFIEHLNSLKLVELIDLLSTLFFDKGKKVSIQLPDEYKQAQIETTKFVISSEKILKDTEEKETEELYRKLKLCCNTPTNVLKGFLPEDFYINRNLEQSGLKRIFQKLSYVYSMVFLSDISGVNGDEVDLKIVGMKTIQKTFNFQSFSLPKNWVEYYKVYEWCYKDGEVSDKLGIARNIISIHQLDDMLGIDLNVNNSIASNYRIYLKENLNRYIEVRNKISDQLLDIVKQANKIVDDFTTNFKRANFAFVSFFASVFVFRILSKSSTETAFTKDAAMLSYFFLVFSLIYLLGTLLSIYFQKKRYKTVYEGLKSRYTDVLERKDIDNILRNDEEYNSSKKFINNQVWIYSIAWIIVVFLGYYVVNLLSGCAIEIILDIKSFVV